MTEKITISSEEFDDYLNIEFENREYRVHYDVTPKQSNLPCYKCRVTKGNTEFKLEAIGAIYDTNSYCQIDNQFEKYDALIQTAIKQIKKERCFVVCFDHFPPIDEIDEED